MNRGKQITNVICVLEGSWVSGLGIFIEIGYDAHAAADPCPCEAEMLTILCLSPVDVASSFSYFSLSLGALLQYIVVCSELALLVSSFYGVRA
jgi:hypothetical protein